MIRIDTILQTCQNLIFLRNVFPAYDKAIPWTASTSERSKIRQITTYLFGFGEDGFDICVAESTINGLLIFGKFGMADFCRLVS